MPNQWTGDYDEDEWEAMLAQLIIGGASAYHPTAAAAAAWQPTDIDGLVFWVKANQITGLSDGDPLGTWEDQSTNGWHIGQNTAGLKPIYHNVGGEQYVTFDGVDDELTWVDGGVVVQVSFDEVSAALFVVFKNTTGQESMPVSNKTGGSPYLFHKTTELAYNVGPGEAVKALTDGQWNLIAGTSDEGDNEFRARVNGVAGTAQTLGAMNHTYNTVGESKYAGLECDGSIKEILMYSWDTNMDAANIALIEAYLNEEHSIY